MMNIHGTPRSWVGILAAHLKNGKPIKDKTQQTDQELDKATQSIRELRRLLPDKPEIIREMDRLKERIGDALYPNRNDPLGDKSEYFLETVSAYNASLESYSRLRRMILGESYAERGFGGSAEYKPVH